MSATSKPDQGTGRDIEAVLGKAATAEDWVETADWWLKSPVGSALPEASPLFTALVDVLRESERLRQHVVALEDAGLKLANAVTDIMADEPESVLHTHARNWCAVAFDETDGTA